MERNIYKIGKELFITSDEVIKEGDWIYKIDHSHTAIFNVHCEELVDDYNRNNNNHKKIIMTTNKDLDGVQAIDAEFLEWFVKNPSFERVEVNIEGYPCMSDGSEITFAQPANLGGSEDIRNNIVSYNKQEHTDTKNFVKAYDKKRYKIIIPKEEPKQETLKLKRNYEKHSLTKTKGYKLWCNIIQRCYNPKNPSYKYYGEKGVIMEDYFKNSYENFINWIKGIAHYNEWLNSSELSLDRIDNTLGYSRGNIKFSTKTEQVENQNLRIDNRSGYKGVCYHKLNKKYSATITINKSKVFLGYYDTALEAALVYDNYVLKNNLNRKTNL